MLFWVHLVVWRTGPDLRFIPFFLLLFCASQLVHSWELFVLLYSWDHYLRLFILLIIIHSHHLLHLHSLWVLVWW